MKKVVCFLVALLVAVSAIATFVPVSAAEKFTVNGEDWYVISDDVLKESGLGDPQFIAEEVDLESESASQWLAHEDWNSYQGWMGWRCGSLYADFWGDTTREVVTTTLSDGT